MQLDRELVFYSDELDFTGSAPSMPLPFPPTPALSGASGQPPTIPVPGGGGLPWPF
jgi:hypothetical protein